MRHLRIFGLALVALFAANAMAASSASAVATGLHYLVGGHALEAGETREILSKVKKAYVLKGEAFTIKTTVECKKQKLASDGLILGGVPGTSMETVVFEECKPTAPAECVGKTVKVENTPVNNELVMILKPAAKAGKTGVLFTPQSGTLFTRITFEGCLFNTVAEVTGNAAALASPENEDALVGTLAFKEGAEEITEIEKHNGTKEKVELQFAGAKATLDGESEIDLTSGETWGIL